MNLYPVALEHAAAFANVTPWDASRDPHLLAESHARAWLCYRHSPLVCGIDVYNIEIEALGVSIEQPAGVGVPVPGRPVCGDVHDLAALPALDIGNDGRLPVLLNAAHRLRVLCPQAEVRVPLAGPFAIAAGLLGLEVLLLALMERPDDVATALLLLAARQAGLVKQFKNEGFAVTLYESSAAPPLVPPACFLAMEMPALKRVLAAGDVTCVLGGDTAPVAAALFASGPSAVICPSETDQTAFMDEAVKHPDVGVRINLPVSLFAHRDLNSIAQALRSAVRLASRHPHASLGTGVLPYDADPDRIHACMQRVANDQESLEVAATPAERRVLK